MAQREGSGRPGHHSLEGGIFTEKLTYYKKYLFDLLFFLFNGVYFLAYFQCARGGKVH